MQGLKIEVSDIEELSDEDIKVLLDILEQVEEITVTENGVGVSKLLSINFYNQLMEGM